MYPQINPSHIHIAPHSKFKDYNKLHIHQDRIHHILYSYIINHHIDQECYLIGTNHRHSLILILLRYY